MKTRASSEKVAYRIVQTATGDDPIRLEPFDAIELDLSVLWSR